jgi:hypothetical protein
MAYMLAPGLHCCDAGGRLIFLDVTADRYFGLDKERDAAVRATLEAQPGESPQAAVETLIACGAWPPDVRDTAAPVRRAISLPRESLLDGVPQKAGLLGAGRGALAILRTRRRLRREGLAAMLAELECLKPLVPGGTEPGAIAAAFDLSRMLLDSVDQCLPHALALAGALFRAGCAAEFVIAVRGRPFRAHSWVQANGVLLNDRLDRVRDFVPILAI